MFILSVQNPAAIYVSVHSETDVPFNGAELVFPGSIYSHDVVGFFAEWVRVCVGVGRVGSM